MLKLAKGRHSLFDRAAEPEVAAVALYKQRLISCLPLSLDLRPCLKLYGVAAYSLALRPLRPLRPFITPVTRTTTPRRRPGHVDELPHDRPPAHVLGSSARRRASHLVVVRRRDDCLGGYAVPLAATKRVRPTVVRHVRKRGRAATGGTPVHSAAPRRPANSRRRCRTSAPRPVGTVINLASLCLSGVRAISSAWMYVERSVIAPSSTSCVTRSSAPGTSMILSWMFESMRKRSVTANDDSHPVGGRCPHWPLSRGHHSIPSSSSRWPPKVSRASSRNRPRRPKVRRIFREERPE
jgi:hypothetical protein